MDILKCCFCCVSVFGCQGAVLRRVAFFPPSPAGYVLSIKNSQPEIEVLVGSVQDPLPPWLHKREALLTTAYGNLIPAVFLQHEHATFSLLFCHGNSTDLGYMWAKVVDLATQLRCSVLLFEYTGYGPIAAKPSEKALYADIRAAYRYLTEDLNVPWSQVVVYGQSLGSALACDLAAELPCAGVVLHSPIASGLRMFAKTDMKTSRFDVFRNVDKVGKIRCPVFFIHGTEDRDVPVRHSEWLAARFTPQYPPWWVPFAGHNDIDTLQRESYYSHLREFLIALTRLQATYSNSSDLFTAFSPCTAIDHSTPSASVRLKDKQDLGGDSCEGDRLEQDAKPA